MFRELSEEIEAFFSPQTSVEWAKQELRKLKQGGSRIEDFMAKFISLKVQGKVSDDFTCALLEQAIKPEVLCEVLLTNTDISIWDDFTDQTLKVGCNLERLQILRGGGYSYQRSSGGVPTSRLLGHSQGPAPPWTSALRAKDNLSKGVIPNATTASSLATSPATAEMQRSLVDNNRWWLG